MRWENSVKTFWINNQSANTYWINSEKIEAENFEKAKKNAEKFQESPMTLSVIDEIGILWIKPYGKKWELFQH